jgi:hypothetical protein
MKTADACVCNSPGHYTTLNVAVEQQESIEANGSFLDENPGAQADGSRRKIFDPAFLRR